MEPPKHKERTRLCHPDCHCCSYAYLAFQRKAVGLKQNFAAVMGQSKLIDDINTKAKSPTRAPGLTNNICYFSKVHTPEGDGST